MSSIGVEAWPGACLLPKVATLCKPKMTMMTMMMMTMMTMMTRMMMMMMRQMMTRMIMGMFNIKL